MLGHIGHRFAAAGIVLLILLAGGIAWFMRRDRGPAARIRHVVLISIDTCRSDHLSCYFAGRQTTPNIDEVARHGTLFENVISPVPLTLPAHSSMLTGTNPTYHDVHDNLYHQFASANLTLAEVLHGNGFVTGAIVSASVLDSRFGLDQGFDEYLDRMSVQEGDENTAERPGDQTTDLAVKWLEQHQGDQFFLFLHYFDPHAPYAPPEPFASRFAAEPYAGEIAFTDDCIGRVIGKLKELGLYDSTLLLIAGDHGEMLGEHGELFHGFFIYQSAIRVPLIVRLPGQTAGRRVRDLVGLVDIVPTVCSLLDVDVPPVLHGEDLSPAVRGGTLEFPPRALYCESFYATRYGANSLLGLVTEQWKYIQTTRSELYDLSLDPRESENLADSRGGLVKSLGGKLQQLVQAQNRQLADSSLQLDEQTRRRLESLGYVGGRDDAGIVRADYQQDSHKDDPKDLLNFYQAHTKLVTLMKAHDYAPARALCQQMIAERPESWTAYLHLAEIAQNEGDLAAAQQNLIEVLSRSQDHVGAYASAHNRLGLVLQSQGELDEAITHFRTAAQLRPEFAGAHYSLGNALSAKGDWEGAIAAYRQALAAETDFAEAHLKLAEALSAQSRIDEAIEHLRQAIRIDPSVREAHYNLGIMLSHVGQSDEAMREFRETVRLDPQWPLALRRLAWLLATSPHERVRDPSEAIGLAERAARATGNRDPLILDALAAAYAASGRFNEAVATAQAAIDLATAAGAQGLVADCRRRLELYQQGQPFRESP